MKNNLLSPHRTLPRFKHSSSDDRRSKTSLLSAAMFCTSTVLVNRKSAAGLRWGRSKVWCHCSYSSCETEARTNKMRPELCVILVLCLLFSFPSQHISRYRYGYRSPEQSQSSHTTFSSCAGETLKFSCGPLSAFEKLMTKETAAQSSSVIISARYDTGSCGVQWSRLILVMI